MIEIRGPARPLVGETTVPGDKSIGHRAVILASLAHGRSRVAGLSGGEDNRRTVEAFRALGVTLREDAEGALVVDGMGGEGLVASAAAIDCGNSGTTMRLLTGVLAARPFASTLGGDQYLEARPMARVATPLSRMGAKVTGRSGPRAGEVYPPLVVGPLPPGARLAGVEHVLAQASAQVKSALLLAGLAADGVTRVREPAPSRDHTERMLRAQGAPLLVETDGAVTLDPRGWDRRLAPLELRVPGDLSSAAFLLGAAVVVPGSVVTVRGVGINPTRTGVLDALRAMGAALEIDPTGELGGEPVADITAWGSPLRGIEIAGALTVRAIDELPLLAAVAAHAVGRTVIRDAAELRVKESDRIAAMAAALAAFGVVVEERPDGWAIEGGGPPRGGRVDSRGDHRIAMASAVCALGAIGLSRVDDTDNVATSFPGFVPTLLALGAELR